MSSNGAPLTEEQERARALAQQRDEAEHQQQQLHEEQERKGVASSLLSRALHFSRAPPPSEPSTNGASSSRLLSVLFLSSTNSIVPHIAAAMTNANHGDHLKARWSTSSPDSPLVDEHASEAMQEHEIDESDDLMTPFESLSSLADGVAAVVTLDDEARSTATTLFPGKPVRRQRALRMLSPSVTPLPTAHLCHPPLSTVRYCSCSTTPSPTLSKPAQGSGDDALTLSVSPGVTMYQAGDNSHQLVVYRQSCNEVAAFVEDLPSVLSHIV